MILHDTSSSAYQNEMITGSLNLKLIFCEGLFNL